MSKLKVCAMCGLPESDMPCEDPDGECGPVVDAPADEQTFFASPRSKAKERKPNPCVRITGESPGAILNSALWLIRDLHGFEMEGMSAHWDTKVLDGESRPLIKASGRFVYANGREEEWGD